MGPKNLILAMFLFFPQLRYLLCFRGKNSVAEGKNAKMPNFFELNSAGIYYIKQITSCAILPATLFWNRAGHLLNKTTPDLRYCKLSYVFWEHNDSIGRGTTVYIFGPKPTYSKKINLSNAEIKIRIIILSCFVFFFR